MTQKARISHIKFLASILKQDPFQGIGHLKLSDVDIALSFLKAVSIDMHEVKPNQFEPIGPR